MIVHKQRFLMAVAQLGLSPWWVAMEIGIPVTELQRILDQEDRFTYEQSRRIIEMLGAEIMVAVINWEALHVRCPV